MRKRPGPSKRSNTRRRLPWEPAVTNWILKRSRNAPLSTWTGCSRFLRHTTFAISFMRGAMVMEIALDVGSMATDDGACCIIEVMGRSAGWIAAGSVLAKRTVMDAPHIILLPEIPLDEDRFLAKVKETIAAIKHCVVVVGEGLRNKAGDELAADKLRLDAFGHPVLSG